MLSVFSEWVQCNPHYMLSLDAPRFMHSMHTEEEREWKMGTREPPAVTVTAVTSVTAKSAFSAASGVSSQLGGHSSFSASFSASTPASTPSAFSTTSAAWDSVHYADAELLRIEARSRSGMRASMAALQPALNPDPTNKTHGNTLHTGNTGTGIGTGTGVTGTLKSTSTSTSTGTGTGVGMEAGQAGRQFLREHVELRGFLPVAAAIEVHFVI
jgi:hypothetical protein